MDLAELNQIARDEFKPTKKLVEMEKSGRYMVTKLKQLDTRYGQKIVAELDDAFQIFLPSRVSTAMIDNEKLFDSMSNAINKMKLFLVYKGGNCIEFTTAV